MTAWVETQVPCMFFCGFDMCTCSAWEFYRILEEIEDEDYWEEDKSLMPDKKALQQNRAYAKYLQRLREFHSSELPAAGAAESKGTYGLLGGETNIVSRSNTTLSQL